VKEIIDILHRHREIFEAKFEWENRMLVKLGFINSISTDGHFYSSVYKIAAILAKLREAGKSEFWRR
jgi:hypothetical protein